MSRHPGSRQTTLIRCLTLLRLLDRQDWTLLRLAEHFGVSTRTIRRDFEALDAAGYLVERGERFLNERGRWRLARRTAA